MAKTTISIRIDPELQNALSKQSEESGRSLTDIIASTLANGHEAQFLRQELARVKWELDEMKRMTEKRIPKTKRVSVAFTQDEYQDLSIKASEANVSKSEMVRRRVLERPIPALTG